MAAKKGNRYFNILRPAKILKLFQNVTHGQKRQEKRTIFDWIYKINFDKITNIIYTDQES